MGIWGYTERAARPSAFFFLVSRVLPLAFENKIVNSIHAALLSEILNTYELPTCRAGIGRPYYVCVVPGTSSTGRWLELGLFSFGVARSETILRPGMKSVRTISGFPRPVHTLFYVSATLPIRRCFFRTAKNSFKISIIKSACCLAYVAAAAEVAWKQRNRLRSSTLRAFGCSPDEETSRIPNRNLSFRIYVYHDTHTGYNL